MRQTIKTLKAITEFFFALIYALFLLVTRRHVSRVVLYYHTVKIADAGRFMKQMEYLARRCTVVKASEIMGVNAYGANNLIVITFDDAFVNVFENAVPILRRYELPASIFVPVSDLGRKPNWDMPECDPDKNETIMRKDQIQQLDKEGFEIFSHTLTHPVLTEIQDGRLAIELAESKLAVEEIVGHKVVGISYPYGSFDVKVSNAAEKAGYKLGFTIEPSMVDSSTNSLQIGRFSVSPRDGLLRFKLKAMGAYQAVRGLRMLKRYWIRIVDTWRLK